ncbi:hypothetical protein [Winogradskyella alexanderae]|uniref:Lipoprotein n=1 Tax=Winogradskyella alexanderae TaxID=2877123 RepID=A0ABS7XNY1_9FLAO|nr:hypothetical protein [Winogradskyella alexanderae]MCA0131712.1 hypothetical protein [Winogradskyella alexanderae]
MKIGYNLLIGLMLLTLACKQNSSEDKTENTKEPNIINFDDKLAFADFSKLNLDEKCVNLLDPRNTSKTERERVIKSWSNFHKKINKFMKEEGFSWEVPDSTISIYNRIYFDKNGTVNYYVFNINNPSISELKKAEFKNVLSKFSKEVHIELQRAGQFAQCGKTKYLNY